jgi:hypothetical protein
MSGSDDGALFRLSPAARSRILTIENSIKSDYMEMIQSLSLTELKSFNKHTYKEMMIPQMKILLPDITRLENTKIQYPEMRIIYDIHKSFESSLSVRLNLREVTTFHKIHKNSSRKREDFGEVTGKVVGVSKMSAGNYMQEWYLNFCVKTGEFEVKIFAHVSGFEYPLSLFPVCYHGTGRIILASTVTSRAQACQIL